MAMNYHASLPWICTAMPAHDAFGNRAGRMSFEFVWRHTLVVSLCDCTSDERDVLSGGDVPAQSGVCSPPA
eukprot:CAMPEP_0117591186 /NCGR_PEP_ID=MMETSP0784-20121206/71392_1 /TAXON_ID=39447 /ORGANISM="" /LENGTH=70 /DNA_ID=CAMNT_0005392879 /DNA_START=1 /DNA_END=210 /DNA_ORIENTATION=+